MYFCANVTLSNQNHPRSIKKYPYKYELMDQLICFKDIQTKKSKHICDSDL